MSNGLEPNVEEIEMNDYSEVNALGGRYKILLKIERVSDGFWEIIEKAPEEIDYLQNRLRQSFINPKTKEIVEYFY